MSGSTSKPLRILLIEDSADDEFLLADHLRRGGVVATLDRVQTAEDMRQRLEAGGWDVVISDYHLPTFDAPGALAVLAETKEDIPFIVVSGSVGEETAVGLMHAGADDYVLKQNRTRLVPALRRALQEARDRRERRRIEDQNRKLESEKSNLLEALKQERDALKVSLGEKEALLKEVHHRVKNNLQIIASLLRLETGRNPDEAAKQVLKDMLGRIQSMALLHDTIYRSSSYAAVDLGGYLGRLAEQLLRTLRAQGGNVRFKADVVPLRVGIDQAIPCGLLVHELLSNCIKHAFPNNSGGTIGLELRRLEDDSACLRVWDNGVGLPADFSKRSGQSLGLQLASDLARQLRGQFHAEESADRGASFAITFKVAEIVHERRWISPP
jgi:two-component sensor histidine kinase/CheY-like chemotaxis protein